MSQEESTVDSLIGTLNQPTQRDGSTLNETAYLAQVDTIVSAWQGRPSWDTYFMATALIIASRSVCSRLHVGCVIVSGGREQNRIIAAGYNGFLPGSPHRSRVREGHEQATVHAEMNAICDAARRGTALEGSTAYITHYPCLHCAKALAACGVSAIKYHKDYRNDPLVAALLLEANIRIRHL